MARGPHPRDERDLGQAAVPALREAVADLGWLLGRGYAAVAALKLVGDRLQLSRRQRQAVLRSSASSEGAGAPGRLGGGAGGRAQPRDRWVQPAHSAGESARGRARARRGGRLCAGSGRRPRHLARGGDDAAGHRARGGCGGRASGAVDPGPAGEQLGPAGGPPAGLRSGAWAAVDGGAGGTRRRCGGGGGHGDPGSGGHERRGHPGSGGALVQCRRGGAGEAAGGVGRWTCARRTVGRDQPLRDAPSSRSRA